jgi:hypothetical protein
VLEWQRTREYHPSVFRIEERIALGRLLAAQVKPQATESSRAWMARVGEWVAAHPGHPAVPWLVRQRRADGGTVIAWLLAWTMTGFQRVVVGHKLAASLMATHAGEDPDVLACAPWDAYTIEIPPEVMRVSLAGLDGSLDVVAVWRHRPEAIARFVALSRGSDIAIAGKLAFPLPEFEHWSVELPREEETLVIRARDCLARLIVGTELEMTDRSLVHAPPTATHRATADSKAPSGVHRLLREVRIDCRSALASYLAGQRRASPSVQTLVRGHFKRVAHGAARAERKWVHIEPYWRGPEDAPLAIRPHRLPDGAS